MRCTLLVDRVAKWSCLANHCGLLPPPGGEDDQRFGSEVGQGPGLGHRCVGNPILVDGAAHLVGGRHPGAGLVAGFCRQGRVTELGEHASQSEAGRSRCGGRHATQGVVGARTVRCGRGCGGGCGFGGVHQDQSGDVVGVLGGVAAHVEPAERMPRQHVGPGDTGVVQQGVQVGGDPGTVLGAVGGVAPAATGAVIHADPGVAGHGGGDQCQRRGHLARAGLEDHSRSARPGAAQVHPVPVDVDQLPGHGVHAGVEGLASRLISGADRHEAQHGEHGGDDPPPCAAVQLVPGLHEHPDHQGEKHGGPHPGQHIVDERGGADEDQGPRPGPRILPVRRPSAGVGR